LNTKYLGPDQVAQYYPGLTADRLARWRWAKTGPQYTKAGRQVLYSHDCIEAYLVKNAVGVSDVG
jgi:hypothetical protein